MQSTFNVFCQKSISTIKLSPKSHDLNIMENVWKLLSDEVYSGQQPRNLTELKSILFRAVDTIITRRLATLSIFANYRKRLTKVLISKGNIINV